MIQSTKGKTYQKDVNKNECDISQNGIVVFRPQDHTRCTLTKESMDT
jgi:hypothetical protein